MYFLAIVLITLLTLFLAYSFVNLRFLLAILGRMIRASAFKKETSFFPYGKRLDRYVPFLTSIVSADFSLEFQLIIPEIIFSHK